MRQLPKTLPGRDVFEYLTKTPAESDFSGFLDVVAPFSARRRRGVVLSSAAGVSVSGMTRATRRLGVRGRG